MASTTNKTPRAPQCPICEAPVGRRGENKAWPFCSDRCKMVDLGRWLGEEYTVRESFRQPPGPGEDRNH